MTDHLSGQLKDLAFAHQRLITCLGAGHLTHLAPGALADMSTALALLINAIGEVDETIVRALRAGVRDTEDLAGGEH